MGEYQWDALAEIYLSNKEETGEIYCLCSRVFIRSRDEKVQTNANLTDEFSVSETEVLTEDDNKEVSAHLVPPELYQSQESNDTKHENEAEIVSCYCSASHTDNISTDEHDSLRETHTAGKTNPSRGLQSSDSGADLTECGRTDYDSAWHKYWTLNGERLIWDSWIAKYSDYINPEFLPLKEEPLIPRSDHKFDREHSRSGNQKFSFERKDLDKYSFDSGSEYSTTTHLVRIDENVEIKTYVPQEYSHANSVLVRTLSGSDSYDKLHGEVSEGWNPLSPISIDCETEAERLLSSRCGSHASSSARTVDSMTNVTRLTVSSFDLSDSSKTSDSFSSVSSVQSSFSSTSSEEADPTDPSLYKQQWDALWKKHYEEEYANELKKFMSIISEHGEKEKERVIKNPKEFVGEVALLDCVRGGGDSNGENFENLLNTLTITMNDSEIVIERSEERLDGEGAVVDHEMGDEDLECRRAMGLPVSFGRQQKKKKGALKRHYDSEPDIEESPSTDHVKSAFNLMGIEFTEADKGKFYGRVEYKMKHIRLQNRHLRLLRSSQPEIKPKHIRFDDDGNIVAEYNKDNDDSNLQYVTGDSDSQESTSSNSEDEQSKTPAYQQEPPVEPMKVNEVAPARKMKRKRKMNLPPEIKENPHLKKYWVKRFSLFNKFDQGIKLDEESWYSVTPEQLAKSTAQRLKSDIIIDAFCGAGGNTIQFAQTCNRVIAIDIDPQKIQLAKNNAEVYGIAHKIEFIVGDFLQLSETLKADVVFLSPPWGGPSYLSQRTYELEEFLLPVPLTKLLEAARRVSNDIALFLPRNSNTYPLIVAAGPGGRVEVEQNFINKKLIGITAYYNDLIKSI